MAEQAGDRAQPEPQQHLEDDVAQPPRHLAEDPLMARGGCRLTTDNSSIDARFEASVAAVLSGLLGDDRSERVGAERVGTEPTGSEAEGAG